MIQHEIARLTREIEQLQKQIERGKVQIQRLKRILEENTYNNQPRGVKWGASET